MKQYIVTITSETDNESQLNPRPQTTVRIEVANGQPSVVELTMRAQAGTDITSGSLPSVDLEYLARAFASSGTFQSEPTVQPSPESPTQERERPHRQPSGQSKATLPRRRAYRKMPDPEELQRVYTEAGSIAGVARHYDVPVHTAQGWIGRLRRRTAASGADVD